MHAVYLWVAPISSSKKKHCANQMTSEDLEDTSTPGFPPLQGHWAKHTSGIAVEISSSAYGKGPTYATYAPACTNDISPAAGLSTSNTISVSSSSRSSASLRALCSPSLRRWLHVRQIPRPIFWPIAWLLCRLWTHWNLAIQHQCCWRQGQINGCQSW